MSAKILFPHRQAGLLLHPTSLPEGPGNGDLGPQAHRFLDFLAEAGFRVWQMLPLGPTHEGHSPYQCLSTHAGNPLLISGQALVERGWLGNDSVPPDQADQAREARLEMLRQATQGFLRHAGDHEHRAYAEFCCKHAYWLDDYALYMALRSDYQGRSWLDWPAPVRNRQPEALEAARRRLKNTVDQVRMEQFFFFEQWNALKDHAAQRDIRLFGDLPIFVALDSADVWANPKDFRLDTDGRPEVIAGVPPDYFSAEGQRWGNPLYDWEHMEQNGFRWWKQRLHTQLEMFDLVRIDHFRGFEAYWEIQASEPTAIHGHWVKGPGDKLFQALQDHFGSLPLVAEDLGIITEEVRALRRRWKLPGMRILQFAFDGSPDNPYIPYNHSPLSVVYTGTHDNDTTVGWFGSLDEDTRHRVMEYLGHPGEPMPWPLIRAALGSVARLAVVPMQDILELGSDQRMNIPGQPEGNWGWRFAWEQVPEELGGRLRYLMGLYGRD